MENLNIIVKCIECNSILEVEEEFNELKEIPTDIEIYCKKCNKKHDYNIIVDIINKNLEEYFANLFTKNIK